MRTTQEFTRSDRVSDSLLDIYDCITECCATNDVPAAAVAAAAACV